ncbi:chromosomal replication initiator protein DnaA [Thermodesulfobacteriota bacterium]
MSTIWEEVKSHIRKELPENSFSFWINPITLLDEKDNSLVLGCPNKFSLNWIMENYKGIMEKKLADMGNNNYKLVLKVKAPEKRVPIPDIFQTSKQLTLPNVSTNRGNGRRRFNKRYTFDRFVVGECNEFAYSASKALAMGGTWPYDSLFLLANTGLGKSHLSQSIGHTIRDNNPNVRAYYITAEDFVNEMIFALKNNRIEEFKNRYRRSCDVLLLEEVHFLSGKEKIQIELGYTLDTLANDKKKIIFTSSLLPKDIPNMKKELLSRLTSGIITTLEKPDYKTRVKIIEKKASERKLRLSEDITHLFAKNLSRDIRQIESALSCLRAKSDLLNAKIDLALAKEVIKCHVTYKKQLSIGNINRIVCKYYKVDPEILRSKSRKKVDSYPRNIYVYLCRNHTDATLEDIGKTINRNHSTILYSSEVIEKKIKIDNRIKNQVNFLTQKIKDMMQ